MSTPTLTPRPRVILGCMTFGLPDGGASHSKIHSIDEYGRCLDLFQERGYDEIDTARVYCSGTQEAFTAQVGYKQRGLTIATKCYPRQPHDHSEGKLLATMDTSLRELDTDHVDIYYLHAADRATPFHETLEAINKAYLAGKFKIFGISNFAAAEVAELCLLCKYNNWVRPTLYQGAYNAINRTAERDLVPVLRRFGLDWVVYNPLGGGFLTGRWLSMNDQKTGRFAGEGVAKLYGERYWQEQTFKSLNVINDAAKKAGISMTEVAFRWIQHHSMMKMRAQGGNDGIIIGASSYAQLEENLVLLQKGPLPAEIVDACEEAWAGMLGSQPPYHKGDYEYTYDTQKVLYG